MHASCSLYLLKSNMAARARGDERLPRGYQKLVDASTPELQAQWKSVGKEFDSARKDALSERFVGASVARANLWALIAPKDLSIGNASSSEAEVPFGQTQASEEPAASIASNDSEPTRARATFPATAVDDSQPKKARTTPAVVALQLSHETAHRALEAAVRICEARASSVAVQSPTPSMKMPATLAGPEEDFPSQGHLPTCSRHALAGAAKGCFRAKYGIAVSHTQMLEILNAKLDRFHSAENCAQIAERLGEFELHLHRDVFRVRILMHELSDYKETCHQVLRAAPYPIVIVVAHWPLDLPLSGKFHAMLGSRWHRDGSLECIHAHGMNQNPFPQIPDRRFWRGSWWCEIEVVQRKVPTETGHAVRMTRIPDILKSWADVRPAQ